MPPARGSLSFNHECLCSHGSAVHRSGPCGVAYCDCQEFIEIPPFVRSQEGDWLPQHRETRVRVKKVPV
jgi:hypothetical protein